MSGLDSDCTTQFKIWDKACWATDESHIVLKQLIGADITDVLDRVDDGHRLVLNSILYYFNTALLSAAFFIFAFILIAGVVYTAQDGQFLGRKWGSAWIPLRAVFGTLMLFPMKATGFCFAQYLMLCVTYVGIGLANYVWYGVTNDVQSGQVLPVQDITAKMELVYRIGQLMMTDIMDDQLADLIAGDPTAKDGKFPFRQKVPITSATFAVSTDGMGSPWSTWFPPAIEGAKIGKNNLPQEAIEAFRGVVSPMYNGLYSIGRNGRGLVTAYVGTLTPKLSGGSCADTTINRNGNCLSYADASLLYRYKVREAVPIDSFLDKIRGRILDLGIANQLKASTCFTLGLQAAGDYRTTDTGKCLSPNLDTLPDGSGKTKSFDYNEPRAKTDSDSLNDNKYYNIVSMIQGYYSTRYDGPDKDDFITPGSAKVDANGLPLSQSNFGYMCGYSDLVAHPCPEGDGSTTAQQNCRKQNEFAGGWFCAGNRYLQFDNLLGINAQNFRTAIDKFLSWQNNSNYRVSVEDTGSSIDYVYAVMQVDPATGKMVATNGESGPLAGPPVVYKLKPRVLLDQDGNPATQSLLGTKGQLAPSMLTWGSLLFPPLKKVGTSTVVDPTAQSLLDLSITRMCELGTVSDKPLCKAYGARLKQLLMDTYQSLQANQPIGDRILTYLSVRYIKASIDTLVGQEFNPLNILVTPEEITGADPLKTTKFLYNFLTFGIYNGFIRSASHPAVPANLPAPPINPIEASNSNKSALGYIFAGLLGARNPDKNSDDYARAWANNTADNSIGGLKTSQTGWMGALYSLGSDCRKKQVDSITPPAYCNDPLIQKQHTMMQRTQVVGLALIGGVVDSMTNAFQSFNDAVTTLAENFADQAAKAAAQGMIMHGLLGGLGDIASGAMGAGPIGMAVAQGNMMVAMAHFGLQLMWLPIVLFIMGAIFTAGLSFAVIIPLTPFILFWAGKVAWILLFLEALLAAPLMALGIVYPDGHDIFGQSEPGVKLAIGMMLMPVLMVIGLLMGITLTYVVIDFTAVGFKTVMQSVLGMSGAITTAPETTQGIISCFLILFYSYILIMAFEKCFSAIHVLPEKVLQWIGIQGQKFGDQEGQQMRSQMQQAGKEGSQAGGQSATQGMQATEQAGKAQGEAAFKKQEAWMGSVNRAADSSRGSMVGSLR